MFYALRQSRFKLKIFDFGLRLKGTGYEGYYFIYESIAFILSGNVEVGFRFSLISAIEPRLWRCGITKLTTTPPWRC